MNRRKRRDQILQTTLKVITDKGYSRVSVSDLVKEAGVSRGTFYLYFNSKKEVVDALLDHFFSDVCHLTTQLFDETLGNKPLSTYDLGTVSTDFVQVLTKHRLLTKILVTHSNFLEDSHSIKIDGYLKKIYQTLEGNIQTGVRFGLFKSIDAKMVCQCIIGTVKEFLVNWTGDDQSLDMENQMSEFLLFVFQMLNAAKNKESIPTLNHQEGEFLSTLPKSNYY